MIPNLVFKAFGCFAKILASAGNCQFKFCISIHSATNLFSKLSRSGNGFSMPGGYVYFYFCHIQPYMFWRVMHSNVWLSRPMY